MGRSFLVRMVLVVIYYTTNMMRRIPRVSTGAFGSAVVAAG
jgi:hypothetical protein